MISNTHYLRGPQNPHSSHSHTISHNLHYGEFSTWYTLTSPNLMLCQTHTNPVKYQQSKHHGCFIRWFIIICCPRTIVKARLKIKHELFSRFGVSIEVNKFLKEIEHRLHLICAHIVFINQPIKDRVQAYIQLFIAFFMT